MKRFALALAAAVLVWGTAPVQAGVVVAKFIKTSPGQLVAYSLNGAPQQTTGGGVFNWETQPGSPVNLGDFATFCIELTQLIATGDIVSFSIASVQSAPIPGSGMGTAKADLIRELWGRFHASIFTHFDPGTAANAFQIAIWEIIYENTGVLNVNNGDFQVAGFTVGGPAALLAQNWLNQLDGTGPFEHRLVALTNPYKQDQITIIPEPATIVIWGLMGTIGICWWRRRKVTG